MHTEAILPPITISRSVSLVSKPTNKSSAEVTSSTEISSPKIEGEAFPETTIPTGFFFFDSIVGVSGLGSVSELQPTRENAPNAQLIKITDRFLFIS